MVSACALCAVAAGQSNGQGGTAPSQADGGVTQTFKYEVVSVREVKGDPKSVRFEYMPDGFSMEGLPLRSLIPDAYGVIEENQVLGWPGWAGFTRFDIEAKMDEKTADALHKLPKKQQDVERQLMMQSLLADRFKLKVHRAAEVRTTYELVLAKGGLKMKEDNPTSDMDGNQWQESVRPSTDWTIADGKITGHAMPISILASHLQAWVDGILTDKTGLTGRYDVALQWDPRYEQNPAPTDPSLPIALEEQLGLHLKPTKTTVETIVIDHMERPSEN